MGSSSRQGWGGKLLLWLALVPAASFGALGCAGCGQKLPSGAAAPAVTPVVRVRVLQNLPLVTFAANRPPVVRPASGPVRQLALSGGAAVTVGLAPDGWRIGTASLPPGELAIDPDPEGTLSVNGQAYRGSFHFVPTTPSTFDVINHVGIDPYLKGVLAREMKPEFLSEAYKAQAIVARTYALYESRTAPPGRSWDLYPDTKSQVYGGVAAESAKSRSAVDETAGVVLAYGPAGRERIFKAYFSACCGGAGQSAAQAFGDPEFEPLGDRAVGRSCAESPRFNWGPVVIAKEELTRRFRAFGSSRNRPEKDIATIQRIDVAKKNGSGRPVQFTVTDARGVRYLLSGEELRWAVNTDAHEPPAAPVRPGVPPAGPTTTLPSSYVRAVADGPDIRFEEGHGFGHGVGLCQWCAQAEAERGVPAERIVLAAFRGSRLVRGY